MAEKVKRERKKCERCHKWREKTAFQKGNVQCYRCANQCKPCGFISLPIAGLCPHCRERKRKRNEMADAMRFNRQSKEIKPRFLHVLSCLNTFQKTSASGYKIINNVFNDDECLMIQKWMRKSKKPIIKIQFKDVVDGNDHPDAGDGEDYDSDGDDYDRDRNADDGDDDDEGDHDDEGDNDEGEGDDDR
jgi:hypothetical protein